MALEVEAKFRVYTHDDVRTRLETLGATYLERVLETNHILDRVEHSLRDAGCGLRVRITAPDAESETTPESQAPACATAIRRTTLTYKGPRQPGPLKVREEIETEVADADALIQVLERLGFQPVLVYEKRRESWEVGDCRIELDEPPHLGLFVEIEGPDERHIRDVQAQLGLANTDLVRESYVHLLLNYARLHAISLPRLELER